MIIKNVSQQKITKLSQNEYIPKGYEVYIMWWENHPIVNRTTD